MSLSLDWTDLKRGGIVGSLLLGDPVGVAVAECDVRPWRPEYPPTLKRTKVLDHKCSVFTFHICCQLLVYRMIREVLQIDISTTSPNKSVE